MVLLKSQKVKIGTPSPDFRLSSVDGKNYQLSDFSSKKILVVMFICNHCPYVQAVEDRILQLAREFEHEGVQFVGICSNDPTDYPGDSPENLLKRWKEKKYGFPYLIDESQEVAKIFGVVCTPEFFVYDFKRILAYHGQLDDNWQEPAKVKRHDLKEAIESLLSGRQPSSNQIPSMGCSIKWRKTPN